MNKGIKIKIPEGCEARIEGNKIILELKENEYERMVKKAIQTASDELEKTSESTSYFSPIGYSRPYRDGTIERPTIDYLIKQKEQKPTITIDQLKSFMLQYLQDAANKKDDTEIEADTDKYAKKILEYSLGWKPSEEQMEALAWYSGNSGVPPTGDKAIKSLYNDLKKL